MRGFFDTAQLGTQTPYKSEKGFLSCVSCGLYKNAKTPKMGPYGNGRAGILVISDCPTAADDAKGMLWQGREGSYLTTLYQKFGVDLFEDCISIPAVMCCPSHPPTAHELACCRQKVEAVIRQHKPKLIILHGASAIMSVLNGHRWKGRQSGIDTWRGWTIPDKELGVWICPTYHPTYAIMQDPPDEIAVILEQDLERAFAKLETPPPRLPEPEIATHVSLDSNEVLKRICQERPPLLAFDIETTGLKPYNPGHRIVSIAFSWDANSAWAIPMPTDAKGSRMLKRIMEDPQIGKIAANMKFEDNWLHFLHGIRVNPWAFDTMIAAHILDNRPGITGLKFQSYVHFGVADYESDVSPYLKAETTNALNRIDEAVADPELFRKLLLYNGIDALMTYRLAQVQMAEMGML